MTPAFIALGANLGDPVAQLREAAQRLRDTVGLHSVQLSPIYFSAPVGVVDQPRFANAAVRLETTLTAHELLAVCHSVERAMGRVRTVRWGPRTIDLDLIFFGTLHLSDEALTLPHPRWSERAFVVQPIYDLAPDLIIDGVALSETLARLDCSDLQRAG
ncbi:MAG TPA: 2-amino-4-hydroxy-6-hydroxymethyldihydropteridine diphosphokinase [Opitutaceae bacterium]|jgi:2-amino-4-hydroxy-6-hydroxymethyldihydropteridine diphosphokinase|nr:2-amino-4-hydroxy-6-hydroxymethyldihydropteridine diphosphokinase [Opitutaceae bacterium]HPG17101.1 2-amino-4-hydroxy-6-hydroxymethyldihydropteridine diphosphokinase [Opitutaceae bacterium]HPN99214.1 2-amino-4-hydroxy-6-hydroxymethyldihydropteridine diphosphokinase [Opitutaceae bacterium]